MIWEALRFDDAAAVAWRDARPFRHLVIDDFVATEHLAALTEQLEEEPIDRYEADLFVFEASAPEPRSPELRALRDDFTTALAAPLSRIVGQTVTRADMRAFAYRPGHYLLPHTDHRDALERVIAYAYYLPTPAPPVGGELELYRCSEAAGELVAIESACVVEPRANRLVLFEVSAVSLHQVREVLAGLRMSLAGWFYR